MHAKSSILWIIHLQSRHFAQGGLIPDATGTETCTPAFAQMFHSICLSNIHLVIVAGLPHKLSSTPLLDKPKQKVDNNKDAEGAKENTSKRKKKEELPWNALLKAALAEPLWVARAPGLLQIKTYCGLAAGDPVLPNTSSSDCRHYLLLGCCRYGSSCKFSHGTATNEQATIALTKLEKFISTPDGLRGNSP